MGDKHVDETTISCDDAGPVRLSEEIAGLEAKSGQDRNSDGGRRARGLVGAQTSVGGWPRPALRARIAMLVRSVAWSLVKMFETWLAIVRGLTLSSLAMAWFARPLAT